MSTDRFIKGARRWSGQIGATGVADGAVTTIPLVSTTNLPTDTAVQITIDRVDANGTLTPAKEEVIRGTVSGTNIINCVRAVEGTAQAHSAGAVVEVILTADQWNRQTDALLVEHTQDGTHKKATQAEVATGTENSKLTTPLSVAPYGNSSMARQAIMNGNFDVWQRGTSTTVAGSTIVFQADRWREYSIADGGTLPTLTRSRQLLTSGEIPNAFYYTRLNTNGAGTSLGVNSYHQYEQRIENGTRNLCGDGKKVTVSFWARSSISNKRICVAPYQNYGTGGSPSAQDPLKGTPITLTSTWTRYTATITTNTLSGKTFGTDNNDFFSCDFWLMWGTTIGNTYVQAGVSAETFVGSGNIDIAQVQLCAGDVALPFQPKSFEEELRACQRYYETSYSYGVTVPTAISNDYVTLVTPSSTFGTIASGQRLGRIWYRVSKRIAGTPIVYPYTTPTNTGRVSNNTGTDLAANSGNVVNQSNSGFSVQNNGGSLTTALNETIMHWSIDVEL